MRLKWKILIAVVMLVILAALWPVMLRHRATSKLDRYRKELAAKGEKLTFAQIAPHPSADEQASARELLNATSSLRNAISNFPPSMKVLGPGHVLLTWKEESLPDARSSNLWPEMRSQLTNRAQEFDALRAILKGPPGEVYLDYTLGAMLPLPHLATQKRAALCLGAAARLELHDGRIDQACEDTEACVALSRYGEREPIMISQLVRMAILQIALGDTWEILQHPNVQEKQLAGLQSAWQSVDPLSAAETTMEMERAITEDTFRAVRENDPKFSGSTPGPPPANQPTMIDQIGDALSNPGQAVDAVTDRVRFWLWRWQWSYDEELYAIRVFQAAVESARKMQRNRPVVATLGEFDAATTNLLKSYPNASRRFMLTNGGAGYGEMYRDFLRKLTVMETERRMLLTAIALRRFQMAHQKFPETLDELTPTYLSAIPTDAMDGKPLRYRRRDDGTFLLYSVGIDGEDNGGDANRFAKKGFLTSSQSTPWTDARDIVWPSPATQEEAEAYKKKMLEEWQANETRSGSLRDPRRFRRSSAPAPAKKD